MYLRFVILKLDSQSGRRQGLFQAMAELRDSGKLSPHDQMHVNEIREWFSNNLEPPEYRLKSSRRGRQAQAISWYKSTATKQIDKMREYQRVLESYGYVVEMIKSSRPGYVVYEDEFQVAAYPFADTST